MLKKHSPYLQIFDDTAAYPPPHPLSHPDMVGAINTIVSVAMWVQNDDNDGEMGGEISHVG